MLNIIKSNISPLRNRRTSRHTNRHISQIPIRVRKHSKLQRLILASLGRIRQAHGRDLIAIDVKARHRNGASLSQTLGGAGIGAEAEVEALQVEGTDAWPANELGVGVQGDLAELEEIDGTGGAGLVGLGSGALRSLLLRWVPVDCFFLDL